MSNTAAAMERKRKYMESLHTRQLLRHLRGLRRLESKWQDSYIFASTPIELKKEIDLCKEILATREHVPSKPEARRIRQLKARGQYHET